MSPVVSISWYSALFESQVELKEAEEAEGEMQSEQNEAGLTGENACQAGDFIK